MQRAHAGAVAKAREILAECKSFCGDGSCRYRGRAIYESQSLSSCGCVSREMARCLCAGKANKPTGPRVN